jgi:hypothetical protein
VVASGWEEVIANSCAVEVNSHPAGHDINDFDDTSCGPQVEPHIVHVDREHNCAVTTLAGSVRAFDRQGHPPTIRRYGRVPTGDQSHGDGAVARP